MRLNYRAKLIIWLVIGLLSPGIVLYVATLFNINQLDPKLGEAEYSADFGIEGRFVNGPITSKISTIKIKTVRTKEDSMVLRISGAGQDFPLAKDGTVGPNLYSMFWFHLPNPITEGGRQKTHWEANVRDELGLLGNPGNTYTAKSLSRFIHWDYILSSQASYRVGIFDGNTRVGSAIYDMTCGMLFELVPNVNGWGRAYLLGTDFPISRNRYNMVFTACVFSIIILGWHIFQYVRSDPDRKFRAADSIWYAVAIIFTVLIDFIYDTWFFSMGDTITAALHIGVIVILFYRFRLWTIPIILELAWVGTYTIATTGNFAPGIVYFPSMLVSVALMIMFRKTPNPLQKA